MPKSRPSRTKLDQRRERKPQTPHERAKLAERRANLHPREALRYLESPSRESGEWARAGILTRAVFGVGELRHLKALVELGGRFSKVVWPNTQRMAEWDTSTTRQWLTVMFDHGWSGQGGHPEAVLSVAEHHPSLLELWHERAPKAWHTRRNWLEGAFIPTGRMDPRRAQAWLEVGATHPSIHKLDLDKWIAQTNEAEVAQTLLAIDQFHQADRTRRRVRGEPGYRPWPWAATLDAAIGRDKFEVVQALAHIHGAPTQDQTVRLVSRSANALHTLDQVRRLGWKLPAPHTAHGGAFLGEAIVGQATLSPPPKPGMEALAFLLLEEGYHGPLAPSAAAHVNSSRCSDELRAALQASELHARSPKPHPTAAVARRRF